MSASSSLTLRKVFTVRDHVDRDELRKLWLDGKVCGMFNIPNESVFDACVDFCVEPDRDDMVVTRGELEKLRQVSAPKVVTVASTAASTADVAAPLQKTIEAQRQQLDALKEQFASKSAELLLEMEKSRSIESRLTKHEHGEKQHQKSLAKLERQLEQERASGAALHAKCQNLEQLNAKLLAQLRDARVSAAEKDARLSSLNDDCVQLRDDLKSERLSVRDLFFENKVLLAKIEELTTRVQNQAAVLEKQIALSSSKRSSFSAVSHPEATSVYQPPTVVDRSSSSSSSSSIDVAPPPALFVNNNNNNINNIDRVVTGATREITQTDHLNAQLLASAMRMDFAFINNSRLLMKHDDNNDDNNNSSSSKW